jgi:hypothetical protein
LPVRDGPTPGSPQVAFGLHYASIVALFTFTVLLVTAGIHDARNRDHPARQRVRLEPDSDLGGDCDQHRVVWVDRAICRLSDGSLGPSPDRAGGAGAIRSGLGDYRGAFWIAGGLCVVAGLSFVTIGRRTFVRRVGEVRIA